MFLFAKIISHDSEESEEREMRWRWRLERGPAGDRNGHLRHCLGVLGRYFISPEVLALKHERKIFRQASNPVWFLHDGTG